jgi:tRNA1Val (adenine37-N6)-methyltransferase
MANSYFRLRKFTIKQDKCAMKICTDACLFGATIANKKIPAVKWLDIGTGTGILPLMIAQKNDKVVIDTVEIDADAALQAKDNIAITAWAPRIQVINEDILTFKPDATYDCIISNPPFFENNLKSPDETVNKAKHNVSLDLHQLLKFVDANLSDNGNFAIMLPYQGLKIFIAEAEKNNLYLAEQLLVKQTIKHKFFRAILFFKRKQSEPQYHQIIIKELDNSYTTDFAAALKDYYLFL